MRIVVVTLFPEFVEHALRFGVLGRAIERGVLAVETVNPRQFATDVHKTVDDRPYGGGPGMVLKAEPLRLAMAAAAAKVPQARRVYLAADGAPLKQRKVAELAGFPALVLVAGRYGGDWPHYTRPEVWSGRAVPPVLIGGNHAAVARWRLQQALGRTWQRRPELLAQRELSVEERRLLAEYQAEQDATRREQG